MEFALFWLLHWPDLDLWFQYPLSANGKSCWDFAHLETKTGIEIHGGLHMSTSGHNTASGIKQDMKKIQLAARKGWTYLAIASDQVGDYEEVSQIAGLIKSKIGNIIL